MRILSTILFLLLVHLTSAQVSLIQPLEQDLVGNKLFGEHEHYFVCPETIRIDSVMPSIGKVYEVTDSSFKYKISHSISKGKMKFNLFYRNGGQRFAEELEYEFVPKTRYSCKILGQTTSSFKPGFVEISAKLLEARKVNFKIYRDNLQIPAKIICMQAMHCPRRGECYSIQLNFTKDPCSLLVESTVMSIKFEKLKLKYGDFFFINNAIIQDGSENFEVYLDYNLVVVK